MRQQGIMDKLPRRVGKRLIGRYLFRIALGTIILVATTINYVSKFSRASQSRAHIVDPTDPYKSVLTTNASLPALIVAVRAAIGVHGGGLAA
jgi:hypothetical protein